MRNHWKSEEKCLQFSGRGCRLQVTKCYSCRQERKWDKMSGKGFHERIMPKLRKMDPESMRNCVRHLARETGFLENIFNTIGEAVLVIDDSLRIMYHNAAAETMLGLPRDHSRLTIDKILRGLTRDALFPKGSGDGRKRKSFFVFGLIFSVIRIIFAAKRDSVRGACLCREQKPFVRTGRRADGEKSATGEESDERNQTDPCRLRCVLSCLRRRSSCG